MPKKYTKTDIENWSVQEVQSWLHSKKLTQCLPDFECVTGPQLLAMTNDDLKALPTVSGNEKKRKALKKAMGQLPDNSISGKTAAKTKGKPAKAPPPVGNIPPSSFEAVPAPPPLPPTSSSFHPPPPASPNSATYSDPSLIWGDEDQPQDIYDNPADAREEMLPPPLPPHPSGYHQQLQVGGGGGYGEEDDDQMIYDQYEEGQEEEEEMFDSSFASEEEEEEEEEPPALNGMRNSSNTGTEANIRAIRAKFFAEGLREHTGILTASTPPSGNRIPGVGETEEESDDDIYDVPPDELKQHPPHHLHPAVQPPYLPPQEEEVEEGEDEDIYDVAEEVLQSAGIPMGKAPAPPPPPPEIYETAAQDEEEEPPPPLPPITHLPPSSPSDTADFIPPRPPKPSSSPALPRKTAVLGSSRPPMRGPIRGGPLQTPELRPPTLGPRPPLPPAVPPVGSESRGGTAGAPPPPPPPPLSPQTSNSSGGSSPRPWAQKKNPPPSSSSSSSSPFAGGRKFPAPTAPSPPRASENKFPTKPSEIKGNRSGAGGAPVPGKFIGRSALRPVGGGAGKTDGQKSASGSQPTVSGKPMSILERIKQLSKPGSEGGEGNKMQPPPKPTEGVSPSTGRRMTRDNSVSDLIKSYHSGGSSDGEKSCPMSPETKPALPVKPPTLSPKHMDRSPQLKRRPIGQQAAGAPCLPEKRTTAAPPWKKAEEQEEQESPKKAAPWQAVPKKEDGGKPWQTKSQHAENRPPWRKSEETTENRPPWRKSEETTENRPPWRKSEETTENRPPWRKSEETTENRPPWRKSEETTENRPPWRKSEETTENRPPWRKSEETTENRPPWRKSEETTENRPPWRKSEETTENRPPWRKSEETTENRPPWRKPSLEEDSQPSRKRAAGETPPSPGVSRGSFTYKPYKAGSKSAERPPDAIPDLPPPRHKDNTSPPGLPPPRQKDNTSPPGLPPPRQKDNTSPPGLPPPRHKENTSPPGLPPPRQKDNTSLPDLPPPRHRDSAPPSEPPRPSDKLRSRFPVPDNAPPEPPRPSLPPERSRFRAPDGPAPLEPPRLIRPLPAAQEEVPPEVPKMANNRARGRVLPMQEEEEMPRLPPRPSKDRPLPTHGSELGRELPQRPWQRPPPAAESAVALPPRPRKSQAAETAPSGDSPAAHSWYHANLKDRKVAEARLLRNPRDGTFIIRDSSRTAGEYSLSLVYHGAVKHLRIRLRGDGQYVLGEEKADEVPFASVVELVNFHKKEPLVLKSGGNITLRYECPQ